MGVTTRRIKDGTKICLSDRLDVASSGALKDALLQAFSDGRRVEISEARLDQVDVTTLQLIAAAATHAGKTDIVWKLSTPAESRLLAAAERAGLQAVFAAMPTRFE